MTLAAPIVLALGAWLLLGPDVQGTIQRLKRARDSASEREAFEYMFRQTRGYSLALIAADGTSVPFSADWHQKKSLTLRIRWGDIEHLHSLIETTNVEILMRE